MSDSPTTMTGRRLRGGGRPMLGRYWRGVILRNDENDRPAEATLLVSML
jgi:hypothetical protein